MRVRTEMHEEVPVVHLAGSLSMGGECQSLTDAVQKEFAAGRYRVVLDLDGLQFVDSAGLGQIVALRRTAAEAGGALVLAGPRGKVRDILQLTRLDQLILVRAGVAEAIDAVRS